MCDLLNMWIRTRNSFLHFQLRHLSNREQYLFRQLDRVSVKIKWNSEKDALRKDWYSGGNSGSIIFSASFSILSPLLSSFFFFWLPCVFIAVHGLSLVAVSGGYSLLWCAGFSLQWLLLLWSTGSRHVGFSSCGMWDRPGPRLEPVSPALAGRFLTTAPPGKSLSFW